MSSFLHYLTLAYLLRGVTITLEVSAGAFAGGLLLGAVLAAAQMSRFRPVAFLARAYSLVFRGTPLILQLVFVYDALPRAGIVMTAAESAAVALAANEASFIAEMLRGGIGGVERGQVVAAQSAGMSQFTVMRRIIAPQAIRLLIPALGNEAINVVKNSSLASVISVGELTLRSEQLVAQDFAFFSVFFASGVMYLGITSVIGGIQLGLERWLDLDRPPDQPALWRRWAALVAGPLRGHRPPAPVIAAPVTGTATAVPPTAVPPTAVPPTAVPPAASGTVPGDVARADVAAVGGLALAEAVALPPGVPHSRSRAERQRARLVEVTAVFKSYGDRQVLAGLDLSVGDGEIVVLMGPSGSGKSTLLKVIDHLEPFESGRITVAGRDLGRQGDGRPLHHSAVARARAQAGIGMVFQHFNLFAHLSALENVAAPLRWVHRMPAAEAGERALSMLDRVGMAARAHALPRHLSGGQQQRVAIARALAPRPRVLLLDEPTSALDPELVQEVLNVIRSLADDGLTMIIATHHVHFALEVADRMVFLDRGVIVEEGAPRQVAARPKDPRTARFLALVAGTAREVQP